MTIGIFPNVSFISQNRVVTSAISARFRTERLRNNRLTKCSGYSERCATGGLCISRHRAADGIFIDCTKVHKNLGTYSTSTIHKSYAASCRHPRKQRSIAEKNTSQTSSSAQSYALKFEDGSQEETERQERCARGDAWRLAKNIYKLKEKDKTTFFSPTNVWCLPAPSVTKPEER